jgi:hypothetical protein
VIDQLVLGTYRISPFNEDALVRLVKVIFVESDSVRVTPEGPTIAAFCRVDAVCVGS